MSDRYVIKDDNYARVIALLDAIHKYGEDPTPNRWVAVTSCAEILRKAIV